MKTSDLIYAILEQLEVAILKLNEDGTYSILGKTPKFYQSLFPNNSDGSPCTEPWKYSDMLAFFKDDAEAFFSKSTTGKYPSTTWQEEGLEDERALVAIAMAFEHEKILIIRRLDEDFTDRVRILQKAREGLLERRELSANLEIYKQKSRYDALTKLYNRGTFMEILTDEIDRCRNLGTSDLSLLMMDIDDFKRINDTYGHLVGDSVLFSLGNILRTHLRRGDVAARYGGEEFVVLASQPHHDQIFRMAENLRKRIEASKPEKGIPQITVSIGCTTYVPGDTADTLIQRADIALYDAKRSNKNNVKLR